MRTLGSSLLCSCWLAWVSLACTTSEGDPPASVSTDAAVGVEVSAEVTAADGGVTGDTATIDVPRDLGQPDLPTVPDIADDAAQSDATDVLALPDVAPDLGADTAPDTGPDVPDVPDAGPPYWPDLPAGYAQTHVEAAKVNNGGMTDSLALEAPPNAVSFMVLLDGPPPTVYLRPANLVTPSGSPIVKNTGDVTCVPCVNRVIADQVLATTLVPNSPEVPFDSEGKYKLQVREFVVEQLPQGGYKIANYNKTPPNVRVLFKTSTTTPTQGTLDLNLWFTGAGALTAATAPTAPRVVTMLADLNTILATAGITVGKVTYQDCPVDTPQTITTTIAVDSDLGKLFALGAEAPPGINVFFVSAIAKEELEGQPGIVLGIAGGIPGPPWLAQGSPHSGVAVDLLSTQGEPDRLGAVLAHELGHYLGLFHTTERQAEGADPKLATHDPIGDTPEFDKTNLMWWAAEGGVTLTPGQRFVMLRHANVWLP